MATIRQNANSRAPAGIIRFLGLNESNDGETQLLLGEAPVCQNWRITENYKLQKRWGYIQLFAPLNKPIRGMWYGKLNGAYHFLFACNGHIYEHNLTTHVNTAIGALTDDKTFFFVFQDKLYILNGHEYKYWDGVTFDTVTGYRPLIRINAPPAGGGTAYEEINMLNGLRHMTFSPDGTAKDFILPETGITSIDFVKVNGVETTAYTADLANGKVTFTVAPAGGVPGSVDIGWTKGTGDRAQIEKCYKALLYGGDNDTRVFVWGNTEHQHRRYFTGLADGVPTAEYFPATAFSDVGSDEFAIVDIVRQYDRQIIFKENETYYSTIESITDTTGATIIAFPVYPLNSEKGSIAPVQVILNNPYSVYEGVYEWISTSVRDERNATYKSKRVQSSLDEVDLAQAITIDYEINGEYWLCVGNKIWIYNYRNDTWYKYILYDTPSCFISIDGVLYFGTVNGQIMQFTENMRTDNGQAIAAEWHMGFYDWGYEWLNKYINKTYISLMPEAKGSINVRWDTNKIGVESKPVPIGYSLLDYNFIDYENWSYLTSYNPQPFKLKTKAKKFVYFKLILENNSLTDSATVLSINLLGQIGGETK